MRILYFLFPIAFALFILPSCGLNDDNATPVREEIEVVKFDSFTYEVVGFTRDTLIVQLKEWDKSGEFFLNGGYFSPTEKFFAKRGDVITLDVNGDGIYEQSGVVDHPWFKIDATFHEQYGPGRAFVRVYMYAFIPVRVSSTYTSHIPWGDYYVLRKDENGDWKRYNFSIITGGGFCNGDDAPYAMGYLLHGDIVGIDYNRDGNPEYEEEVVDPNHT